MPQIDLARSRKAAFFDRDGVLNVDHGYVHRYADWEWTPGAVGALGRLRDLGYRVLVVTNQSGIARGYYGEDQMHELHARANEDAGGLIDQFYFCPHGPDSDCSCRKPEPGMILAGLEDWGLDPKQSFLVGDKASDIEAATAAGVRGFLFTGGDLSAFVNVILAELGQA